MKKQPETSIIIRTKNEARWLKTVLEKLSEQTYSDFEIIIIDSGSKDKTLQIAKQFPVKIFEIPQRHFSYPYALNFGCRKASATKYFVFIPGHSLPISKTWLEDGLKNFSRFKQVCGVYGLVAALPDGTFWDKVLMNGWNIFYRLLYPEQKIHKKIYTGILGFTNGIVRKDLWGKLPFDEKYGAGGEEAPWAKYWFDRGYIAIQDTRFTVQHCHYLGLAGWWKQWQEWVSLKQPKPFKPLSFRNSPTHEWD